MGRYTFIQQLDFEVFNAFSEQNGGSVYQTSYWAEVKSAWHPFFYMGYEDDKPVLCALCLERNVKVGRLWYVPDGIVCDLYNEELIREFTVFIKSEMKRYGVCALVCDPLVPEKINREDCDVSAIGAMLKNGFVLNKEKSFYIVQPCIAIQTRLTGKMPQTLLPKCEKGVRHGLKAAEEGCLICETYDDKTICKHPEKLDDFFDVMTETSDRVSFIQRDKEYYKKIITALRGKALMDIVYCDNASRKERVKNALEEKGCLCKELETADDKKTISAIKKRIEALDGLLVRNDKVDAELEEVFGQDVPDRICLGAGITARFGKTAICFYGGTKNLLRNTLRPTHFLNWTRILKSFDDGIELHDLGRVTGDPYDETNPLYGLCRYKQSYDGEVTEYVGDMYLIVDKFRFMLFRKLLPKFKKFKNTVLKKRIKTATVKKSA